TESHAFTNLSFAVVAGLCVYNFVRAVMLDPGTCPKPASDGELKSIIEELASEGRLNGQTFCIQWHGRGAQENPPGMTTTVLGYGTVAIRPLCPHARHRYNIIRLFNMAIAPPPATDASPNPNISPSCALPTDLCLITSADTFLFSVTAWATLQLSWTIVLLASQLWQIARQMTTLEVSNLGRYGFMGGRGGQSMQGQMGHTHGHGRGGGRPGSAAEDAALMGMGEGMNDGSPPSTPGHRHNHNHNHAGCSPRGKRWMVGEV
ncbi:hypothetical protein MPER_07762, partial [Moniliophthora perniciosa FA553]